jgi:predicted GNAT family N-acyltransferase
MQLRVAIHDDELSCVYLTFQNAQLLNFTCHLIITEKKSVIYQRKSVGTIL